MSLTYRSEPCIIPSKPHRVMEHYFRRFSELKCEHLHRAAFFRRTSDFVIAACLVPYVFYSGGCILGNDYWKMTKIEPEWETISGNPITGMEMGIGN